MAELNWAERQAARIDEALRYYLGPAYEPVQAMANLGAAFSPGGDMMDMQAASSDLVQSKGGWDTVSALGGLGTATLGMAIPGRPKQMADEVTQGIRAYHGSPHDFDRFSLDKIGTGEGAQAYGHGLYFAEKEGVAKSYRDTLAGREENARQAAKSLLDNFGGDFDKAAAYAEDTFETQIKGMNSASQNEKWGDAIALLRSKADVSGEKPPGHMYEVNIAANPDDFLDWDRPLSEQSEKVRGVARDKGLSWGETKEAMSDRLVGLGLTRQEADEYAAANFYDSTGAMAYRELGDKDAASQALREAGIPGIRYLDQGSRTAGDGSRNYVVFDEEIISILRKYGLLGAIGLGTAAAMQPDQQPANGGL